MLDNFMLDNYYTSSENDSGQSSDSEDEEKSVPIENLQLIISTYRPYIQSVSRY